MISPKSYDEEIERIECAMLAAHKLGMYRTAELLHAALNTARAERFEAQPQDDVTIEFSIGPVREQRT